MIRPIKNTEMILAAIVVALLLLILGVLGGVGHSVDWLGTPAPQQSATAKQAPILPTAELSSLSNTWQTPLFSTNRSPDVPLRKLHQVSSLADLTLTGVILNGEKQVAFIRQKNGPALKVHRGERLPSGWTLYRLSPLQASFTLDGRTESLSLPVLRLPPPSIALPTSVSHESTP